MSHEQNPPAPLLEALAALEHARWAHWMRYLFSCCTETIDGSGDKVIPGKHAIRWGRQIETVYADLSEQEKESDRKEVRKTLELMKTFSEELPP